MKELDEKGFETENKIFCYLRKKCVSISRHQSSTKHYQRDFWNIWRSFSLRENQERRRNDEENQNNYHKVVNWKQKEFHKAVF